VKGGPIVSDASPIIAYHSIGRLDVLQAVFGEIVIPPVVSREIGPSVPNPPSWIRIEADKGRDPWPSILGLDPGERAAIELALHLGAAAVVLDDLAARTQAARLGLRVTGSVGVAVRAKQRGIVDAARPLIDALVERGLFLDRRIYRQALLQAGEPFDPPTPDLPA
jgi:uncharacterized protein